MNNCGSTFPAKGWIYTLFFLTGACGLVYQVLWARMFGLVFGNTVYASSTVLAAFMAGLALGSFAAGKYSSSIKNHLRLYAVMELCIGIAGVIMPFAVHAADGAYGLIYRQYHPGFGVLTLARFVLSFVMVLVPCIFMGASLPVITGYAARFCRESGRTVAVFYGINTLGAFTGCFSAGFLLIGGIGLMRTSLVAAGINILAAAAAFIISRRPTASGNSINVNNESPAASGRPGPLPAALVLTACSLAGFAALGMEVAWIRSLVWVIGTDSYAFAHMLAAVLAGIGIGSIIVSRFPADAEKNSSRLFVVLFLLGIAVMFSTNALCLSCGLNRWLQQTLGGLLTAAVGAFPRAMQASTAGVFQCLFEFHRFLVPSFVILVPAVLMGTAFPVFAAVYGSREANAARSVGAVYAVNTLGGIAGSILMGFFLIPAVGLFTSIIAMGVLYFAAAALVAAAAPNRTKKAFSISIAVLIVPAVAIPLLVKTDFKDLIRETLRPDSLRKDERLLYFKEYASGGVMVKESGYYGREMCIDGVQVASTGEFDLHSHLFPAHLVSLLRPGAENALFIAFGAGGTAGSLLLYDNIRKLDVVEICGGVVEPARRYFTGMNRNVLDNPRLNLIIQDGRNYVRMTDKRYDIIYSGPIHPQTNQGSAALYTREFFSDCRRLLTPGGIQCVWLPLHMRSTRDFKTVVRSFLAVYPHVTLWLMPQTETSICHPHLIGSMNPLTVDYRSVAAALARTDIIRDLERTGDCAFHEPCEFIGFLAMSEERLRRMADDGDVLNTDDRPVVEFYNLEETSQDRTKKEMILELGKYMEQPLAYVADIPDSAQDSLVQKLDRQYAGNQFLLLGHFFYLSLMQAQDSAEREELRTNMVSAYSKAMELIPSCNYPRRIISQLR